MTDHEILLTGLGAHTFRFPLPATLESELAIPRKLHMVWIGSVIPERYLANVRDFALHNPGWAVTLWVDNPVDVEAHEFWALNERPINLTVKDVHHYVVEYMHNRDLFLAETNVAAKVDLLRYEIVNYEGGVYLDADTLSLGPGSLSRMTHSFLTVSGPPYYNTGNAQFGFAAGSEFLGYVIANARDPRARAFRGDGCIPDRTGPTFLTTCALSFGDMRIIHPNGRELLALVRHLADKNW